MSKKQQYFTLLLAIILIFTLGYVDARGKKKKGSSANAASCASKGLDCSATCCLDSTCALDLADCAGYINREYTEIYIGFGTLVALVIGIPMIISCLNFCLMYKFCQKTDEEDNSKNGGFTICEIIPRFMCCCLCNRNNRTNHEDDDDLEAEGSENSNLKAECTEKTQHTDNHKNGKLKSSGKFSPSGSNDDIKATNRSSQDEDDFHKSDNHSKKGGKSKKKQNNKCVKCLCIVFCCADSNINEDDNKGNDDGQVLLNKNEEIDFDPRRGHNPSKQGSQRILVDKLNESSNKGEVESIHEEEEENGVDDEAEFE